MSADTNWKEEGPAGRPAFYASCPYHSLSLRAIVATKNLASPSPRLQLVPAERASGVREASGGLSRVLVVSRLGPVIPSPTMEPPVTRKETSCSASESVGGKDSRERDVFLGGEYITASSQFIARSRRTSSGDHGGLPLTQRRS